MEKYYNSDLTISITEVVADNPAQVEEIMQTFIDRIALIMNDVIRWDEVNYTVEENILDEKEGVWVKNVY